MATTAAFEIVLDTGLPRLILDDDDIAGYSNLPVGGFAGVPEPAYIIAEPHSAESPVRIIAEVTNLILADSMDSAEVPVMASLAPSPCQTTDTSRDQAETVVRQVDESASARNTKALSYESVA